MKTEMLYGRHAVLESLRAGRRVFRQLLMAQGIEQAESLRQIMDATNHRRVRVESVPRPLLDSRTQGANHQGVMLEASRYPYADLDDVLAYARSVGQPPFLLLLDLLQDVQNVGTLLRTAEAVGVHGVIIQQRRAADITPAVVNASSGAVEHLQIVQVTNLVQTIKTLKEEGVWLAGLDLGDDAVRYDQANLKGPMGLVVGSEGHGLRRLVRETCDFIISLPMQGQIESLNAAVAGSLALYATWQARGFTLNRSSQDPA